MITVGIDVGTETIKVVLLKDEEVPRWLVISQGIEPSEEVAERALSQVLTKAGISRKDIDHIVTTGVGKKYISFANRELLEFPCLAKGIDWLLPSARTVLALGAQNSLAVRCNGGRALKFATSSKCAAGSGAYLEIVSNVLGIKVDEMAALSSESREPPAIQATCAVFAESEIISLIHMKKKTGDILRGVFKGLAERIYPLLLQVGIEKDVAIVGGVAKNAAMVVAVQELVGYEVLVPDNPDIVSALGAALIARDERRVVS